MLNMNRAFILVMIFLTGCANTSTPSHVTSEYMMAIPRQAGIEHQAAIARLTEEINLAADNPQQLAQYYYDRGIRYDALGLNALAHFDFNRALRLKADFADAYNFIGIHYTQGEQFADAFESFSSALELNPEHHYALLNRGIARYYAGREQLAAEDFQRYYSFQQQDPYRVLWLYLAEWKSDPKLAATHLAAHRDRLNQKEWATAIVDLYLQRINLDEFLKTIPVGLVSEDAYAERLCEAYFYLGKLAEAHQQHHQARRFFKLALATNVYDFVEHRYALLELQRLMM